MMPGRNLDATPAINMRWTLRYAIVKPDRVFNWLGMMNVTSWVFFPELRKDWWGDKTVQTRTRIQDLYIKYFDALTGHFTKLEQSLQEDGFHAPVNTLTGLPRDMHLRNELPLKTLPPSQQHAPNRVLLTHTFGGSRTIIAQRMGMDIPCFIYDFTNAFSDAEVLQTTQEVKRKFPDSYSIGNPQSFPVARAISHTHFNGKNDGNEKNIRLKVIDRIRKELSSEGVL